MTGRDVDQRRREKPARNGANLSRDRSSGEAIRDSRGKILDVAKNSPEYSIRVVDLRFDHMSKGIDIFLDVEHRQRHGTREPYRRLRKVLPRTYPTDGISHFGHSEGGRRGM